MNIAALLLSFGLLIIAMTVHEWAHGFTAYKLGDSTAKSSGRLTLNPLAHIDPFWTIVLPLFLYISTQGRFVFGSAKPVPINYWSLRNPKRDIIWIGLSGPLANFVLAFLVALIIKMIPLPPAFGYAFSHLIIITVVLGVFNLIPIPPLDGSRVLMGLLPEKLAANYARIEPYGFIIVMLLVALNLLDFILWPAVIFIIKLIGL